MHGGWETLQTNSKEYGFMWGRCSTSFTITPENFQWKVIIAHLQRTDILGIHCETPGLRRSSGFIKTVSLKFQRLMDILFYCILLCLIF